MLGACHEAKYVVQLSSNSVMANNTGDWPISGVINKKAHLKCNHDMGLKLDGSTHQPWFISSLESVPSGVIVAFHAQYRMSVQWYILVRGGTSCGS